MSEIDIEQLLEEMNAELAKALQQRDRWMAEARYWYARAQRLATTGAPYPVIGFVPDETPAPVVSGGVQVAEL